LGNPKFKLRMKVHRGNTFEDAGPMIRGTDAKNPGHQLRWLKLYKESQELKHQYGETERGCYKRA
jgi:hypothetical protein